MKFKPFDRMWERVETQKDISDAAYFNALMYLGEMFTKFTVAAMVAAVNDGRDRQQYRLRFQLVRADGIGVWHGVLDELLRGVAAQHVCQGIQGEGNEVYQLTRRTKADAWQHQSASLLFDCLKIAESNTESAPKKIQGKLWFQKFAELRNSTRAHRAPDSGQLRLICPNLHKSISIYVDNFCLFERPWAYLDETLKGRYYVVKWTEAATSLDPLKTREGENYNFPKGVYIHYGRKLDTLSVRRAELISSDLDSKDFFLPNGGWNEKRYEMLSYISNDTFFLKANDYLEPIDLPPSETSGLKTVIEKGDTGGTITNVPAMHDDYIPRNTPEENLYREIVEDTPHHIVTLRGRGGVGKTWLTLKVLDDVARGEIFTAILWFSARDIDLLQSGVRQVKPDVLDKKDIARVFAMLMGDYLLSVETLQDSSLDKVKFLENNMRICELGKVLFVFDNFETVTSPIELYNWIYNNVRPPNKAVITTRKREFKGDYPIELEGMSFDECKILIDTTVSRLNICHLISRDYTKRLFDSSDGHPYVIKIFLGEVKKENRAINIEEIIAREDIARHDDLLNVLFERTYSGLSPTSRRIFLTLCNWKSLVAETAIKAVLLRPQNEQMGDLSDAIEELFNSSMIEKSASAEDNEFYWGVNLVAREFGLRKLKIDASKIAIEADTKFLQFFGTTQKTDLTRGIKSRLDRLFKEIETKVLRDSAPIADFEPIYEQVAKQGYPEAWLQLAKLHKKLAKANLHNDNGLESLSKYEKTLTRYLQFSNDIEEKIVVWGELADFYEAERRFYYELSARIQLAQLPNTGYATISNAVNRFNNIDRTGSNTFDAGEKNEIVERLIELMESRIEEANDDDCSRLGWLYMHNNQPDRALEAAERGLQINPANHHCLNLKQRAHNF